MCKKCTLKNAKYYLKEELNKQKNIQCFMNQDSKFTKHSVQKLI